MMRIRLLLALVLCAMSVPVPAREAQLDVMIGDSYLRADLDIRWPRESSYLLAGMGGVYCEYGVGAHFWLFEKAAIMVAYRDRKFDMTRGWHLSDGIFTVGLGLSF